MELQVTEKPPKICAKIWDLQSQPISLPPNHLSSPPYTKYFNPFAIKQELIVECIISMQLKIFSDYIIIGQLPVKFPTRPHNCHTRGAFCHTGGVTLELGNYLGCCSVDQ